MRKYLFILLTIVISVSMFSCGGDDDDSSVNGTDIIGTWRTSKYEPGNIVVKNDQNDAIKNKIVAAIIKTNDYLDGYEDIFSFTEGGKCNTNGTYTINGSKLTITNAGEGSDGEYTIIKVTDSELILDLDNAKAYAYHAENTNAVIEKAIIRITCKRQK